MAVLTQVSSKPSTVREAVRRALPKLELELKRLPADATAADILAKLQEVINAAAGSEVVPAVTKAKKKAAKAAE